MLVGLVLGHVPDQSSVEQFGRIKSRRLSESNNQQVQSKRSGRKRRWPWVFGTCLLVLGGLVWLALARLQSDPLDAGPWLTAQMAAEADALLPGAELSFRRLRIGLDGDYHPQVYLDDVTIGDAAGAPLVQLRSVQGDLTISQLLRGEVELRQVLLSGAVLRVDRNRSGDFNLAFGAGQSQGASGAELRGVQSVGEAFARLDSVLARPALAALREVSAESITVNYIDGVSGQTWTGDGGQLRLFRDDDGGLLMTAVAALLTGRQDLAALSMSFERDGVTGDATIAAVIEDAAASDIASQSPALAFLTVVDSPVSAAMRADVTDAGLSGLSMTLELGAGVLQPTSATRPIPFSDAGMTLSFDPALQRIRFEDFRLETDWGRASARGTAQLQDFDGIVPREIVGQFTISNIAANPLALYASEQSIEKVSLDMRLRLDPFTLDIGQAVVVDRPEPDFVTTGTATGRIAALEAGWDVSLDVGVDQIETARALDLWPESLRPRLRLWFANNMLGGILEGAQLAIRSGAGATPRVALSHRFRDGKVQILRTLPPIERGFGTVSVINSALSVQIEGGRMVAPQGGALDAAGTVVRVADLRLKPAIAQVDLRTESTVTAVLSVLDQEPFEFLSQANQPVTLADGRARVTGSLRFPMQPRLRGPDVEIEMVAELSNLRSEILVKGKVLSLPSAVAEVTNTGITISGSGRLGRVAFDGAWAQVIGQGPVGSELRGRVEISPAALDEFSIDLPPGSIGGEGRGDLVLSLPRGSPPEFVLTSDLAGLSVSVPQVGYRKPPSARGAFEVAGTLGPNPQVERLSLSAPGLSAQGRIRLLPGGKGLEVAQLDSVDVGGWLTGALTLTGRGAGRAPAIDLSRARIDMRRADFAPATGAGEGPPLTLQLDRLQIAQDIVLTNLRADLTTSGGLAGPFTAQMAGGAALQGNLQSTPNGPLIVVQSADGGGVIRDAGIFPQVTGGDLALTLVPRAAKGTYDGVLDLSNIRVRDAPSVAALLSAVSVVGLLEQMDGGGLVFSEVDAKFRLTPDQVIVTQSSAVGASLGLSLDGTFDIARRRMDFQGVVSPFFLLNGIGSVFTRRGEGLIGFNFTLNGSAQRPDVAVNPLSILTPGMFREIFRRAPPRVGE